VVVIAPVIDVSPLQGLRDTSSTGFLSTPGPFNVPIGYYILFGVGLFGMLVLALGNAAKHEEELVLPL
jgi:hypothetical protein